MVTKAGDTLETRRVRQALQALNQSAQELVRLSTAANDVGLEGLATKLYSTFSAMNKLLQHHINPFVIEHSYRLPKEVKKRVRSKKK